MGRRYISIIPSQILPQTPIYAIGEQPPNFWPWENWKYATRRFLKKESAHVLSKNQLYLPTNNQMGENLEEQCQHAWSLQVKVSVNTLFSFLEHFAPNIALIDGFSSKNRTTSMTKTLLYVGIYSFCHKCEDHWMQVYKMYFIYFVLKLHPYFQYLFQLCIVRLIISLMKLLCRKLHIGKTMFLGHNTTLRVSSNVNENRNSWNLTLHSFIWNLWLQPN